MNPFDNILRYAQGDVPSLARSSPSDNQDAGFMLKNIANFVGAQIPHSSNFSDGIMSFDKSPGINLTW
jgi:hypothetical protein